MGVHEGRRDETPRRVDRAGGVRRDRMLDPDDPAVPDRDVDAGPPVGKGRGADEEVEAHEASSRGPGG